MKALERHAQTKGIFPKDLMENAGRQVYTVVHENYDLSGKHIIIFCGQGNNGGDGFVAAKYFAQGNPVVVLFFGEKEKLTEEAREKYDELKNIVTIVPITSPDDLHKFHIQPTLDLVLVDALLGTGIQGELRDPISFAIDYFNSLSGIKIAVDIPSGLDLNSENIKKKVCEFDVIITFHDIKNKLEPLKEKTIIVDIGLNG